MGDLGGKVMIWYEWHLKLNTIFKNKHNVNVCWKVFKFRTYLLNVGSVAKFNCPN